MRKFLTQLFMFCLPLAAVWVIVLNVNVSKEFSYNYIKDECEGAGQWMYSRMYLQNRPADIVFIGASRTMRAVDDSLLQHYYDSSGANLKILNAGFCRFGRDMFTLIAEDVINSQAGMRTLVFEVNEREGSGNHPIYWTLAGTKDLLYPESFVNQSYFSNIYSGTLMRFDYLRSEWLSTLPRSIPSGKYFGCLHTDAIAGKEDMDDAAAFCAKGKHCNPPGAWEEFELGYNKAWIERLSNSCKAQNIELVFFYLPQYGCSNCPPRELEFYLQFGRVLIPPSEILDNRKYWSDHDHFNTYGSKAMAKWLYGELNLGQN